MTYIPENGFTLITEDAADDEVATLYADYKRYSQSPHVPNIMQMLGNNTGVLQMNIEMYQSVFSHLSLPMTLMAMIHFTVAHHANCEYCAATNELMCRTLGVDDATLAALSEELGEVNPERVRVIIEFALKVAEKSQQLTREDYDTVRDEGVSDEELVEIIYVTGLAVFNDIMADAFKVEVDDPIQQALDR